MVVLCSNRHSAAVFSIQRSKHQDTEGHRGTEIEPKRRPTERRLQTVIALKLTPFWDDLGCGGLPGEGGGCRTQTRPSPETNPEPTGECRCHTNHPVVGKPTPTRAAVPQEHGLPNEHAQTYANLGGPGMRWDPKGGGRKDRVIR
jgi:hypothetical protein